VDAESASPAGAPDAYPGFIQRPGLPDAFQEEAGSPAWQRSLEMAAGLRAHEARERRDDARLALRRCRRERRTLRREARAAKPGQREAVEAELDRVEGEIRLPRSELRKAERALARYEPRGESRSETSRPATGGRMRSPFPRWVLPRKTPIARAAARRPGCRRTTRSTGPPGDDGGEAEPPGEIAGRHLTAGAPA